MYTNLFLYNFIWNINYIYCHQYYFKSPILSDTCYWHMTSCNILEIGCPYPLSLQPIKWISMTKIIVSVLSLYEKITSKPSNLHYNNFKSTALKHQCLYFSSLCSRLLLFWLVLKENNYNATFGYPHCRSMYTKPAIHAILVQCSWYLVRIYCGCYKVLSLLLAQLKIPSNFY